MLSVILPAYNEELMISKAAQVISEILDTENIKNEIIFVDDGSSDKTWEKIESISKEYFNVRGVHFSRNFGKESAILAGLQHSKSQGCECAVEYERERVLFSCSFFLDWV